MKPLSLVPIMLLALTFFLGCKKSVPSSSPMQQHTEVKTFQALSHSGAPFYAFRFTDGQVDWVLLLEGGYFFQGASWSKEEGSAFHLTGLEGRESVRVPIPNRGDAIFIRADGTYSTLDNPFRFAKIPEDIYSGSIDITRFPELEGINKVFITDRTRELNK